MSEMNNRDIHKKIKKCIKQFIIDHPIELFYIDDNSYYEHFIKCYYEQIDMLYSFIFTTSNSIKPDDKYNISLKKHIRVLLKYKVTKYLDENIVTYDDNRRMVYLINLLRNKDLIKINQFTVQKYLNDLVYYNECHTFVRQNYGHDDASINNNNNKNQIMCEIINIIKTRYNIDFNDKKYFNYIDSYMSGKNPIA